MCVLYDIELQLMSSLFTCDRGTQGKSFLTQINTTDVEPQQIPRSQVHILKLKKPKWNVTAHTLGFKQPSCQRNGEVIPIWVGKKKKIKFYFRWLALLFDNFVMQRWKSSAEISEHSTRLQNQEATDNLIWSSDLQSQHVHLHTCTRRSVRRHRQGDEQSLHTGKTGAHTHTSRHT